MNAFVKLLLVCVCTGAFISNTTAVAKTTAVIPSDVLYSVLVEIHGNNIPGYPTDALWHGAYLFPFDRLGATELVAIKVGTGTELRQLISFDPEKGWLTDRLDYVTRGNYFCFVSSVHSILGHDPIPESSWNSPFGATGTRVLIETVGQSMLPTFPEAAIMTATVGIPYKELRHQPGTIVVYWNPPTVERTHQWTVHRLTTHWSWDDSYSVKGDNNPRADSSRVNSGNYLCVVHGVYRDLTIAGAMVASTK